MNAGTLIVASTATWLWNDHLIGKGALNNVWGPYRSL